MKTIRPEWLLFKTKHWMAMASASALMFSAACGENKGTGDLPVVKPEVQPTPPEGATDFLSADAQAGQQTQENTDDAKNEFDADQAAAPEAGDRADDRTVEEGDIYRVMSGSNMILNLNAYRGLQIIDFANPAQPKIVGQVQVTGTPVEMYQVGNRAYILLNNWRHYYYQGSKHATLPEQYQGGGVIVVDISDVTKPRITAKGHVPGWIRTSRLTRGNGKEALFVVASEYNGGGKTYVKSFSVSDTGKLQDKTKIELGGFVQDIQATPERLIVARHDYQKNKGQSEVSLIDITSPEGTMVEGASILVKGRVQNKFNMNIHNDVLRVVSGNNWQSTTNTNHVETFDVKDFKTPRPLDAKTFGNNEDLYATLFLENKAFFVTYRRVDPFHAFSIDDQGNIVEKSEFIVSGWNDYFKPVAAKSRLIGIGKNDVGENGERINTMAVSLYDITDLTNTKPLIDRKEIELDYSWSEAQWDDRAFSVLEKATDVLAPDGMTKETGLVLLPFSGWNDTEKRYISAVQIYTFSNNTLTLRGVMEHGTPVRRSFMADKTNNVTGNISEAELSLFDTKTPQTPSELGRVELAPNYGDFKIYGNYGVRHHDRTSYYGWWGNSNNQTREDSLQVVALSGDIDKDEAVAEIRLPANAQTHKHGNKLISISSIWNNTKDKYDSEVEIWDMSTPTAPKLAGTLQTDAIRPSYGYYGGYYPGRGDCWECDDVAVGYSYYNPYHQGPLSVGDTMVFPSMENHRELTGRRYVRNFRPKRENRSYRQNCYDYDTDGNYQPKACEYHQGGIYCSKLTRVDGTSEAEVCSGQLQTCKQDDKGNATCTDVKLGDIPTDERKYDYEQYRYWNTYHFDVLDLSNPAAPKLLSKISMPASEEAANAIPVGNKLYISYKKPARRPGDSRPYVRYFFKTIDLTRPSNPIESNPVNIPGTLIAVDGDTLLTRDTLWGDKVVETSINKLKVFGPLAYLQGVYRFTDQLVQNVALDHDGSALVSHQTPYYVNRDTHGSDYENYDRVNRLSILDLRAAQLNLRSTTDVDNWAVLKDARKGRALYQVPGGLLVMNLDNVDKPYAQAYFPTRGWPRDVNVEGNDIFFSAGPFGLYRFDLNINNLALP